MRKAIGLGLFTILAVIYFVSPYWAAAGLSRAVVENQPDSFAGFVDFETIKHDIARKVSIASPMRDQHSAAINELIAIGAIEKFVSPEGLMRTFSDGMQPYAKDSRLRMTWGLITEGNLRWISPVRIELGPAGSMRRTLFSWKLDKLG